MQIEWLMQNNKSSLPGLTFIHSFHLGCNTFHTGRKPAFLYLLSQDGTSDRHWHTSRHKVQAFPSQISLKITRNDDNLNQAEKLKTRYPLMRATIHTHAYTHTQRHIPPHTSAHAQHMHKHRRTDSIFPNSMELRRNSSQLYTVTLCSAPLNRTAVANACFSKIKQTTNKGDCAGHSQLESTLGGFASELQICI